MSNQWVAEQRTPTFVANQLLHGFAKKDQLPEMNDQDFRLEVSRRLEQVGYRLITYTDSDWWGSLNNQDSLIKLLDRKGLEKNARAIIAVLWRELVWPCVQQTSKNKQAACITEEAFRDKYAPLIGYICKYKSGYSRVITFLKQNRFIHTVSKSRLGGIKRQSVWEAGPALELWVDRDIIQTEMDQTFLFYSIEGGQSNAKN